MSEDPIERIKKAYLDNDYLGSHWNGCYMVHPVCAIAYLVEKLETQTKEVQTSGISEN